MIIKKYIFSLLMIFLIIATGCSKQIFFGEENSSLLNYNFTILDLKDIDKTLSKQRYSYSLPIDKKSIAVVTYQSKKASIKQYAVNNFGVVDLIIPKNTNFIISLPANSTTLYTWNIKNSIDNGIINFENSSQIEIPLPKPERGKEGANYDRQNFYFTPLKLGNEKIIMRREHQTEQRDDFFEITLNIEVQ